MLVTIGDTQVNVRVEAVMSVPRLGFMDNFFNWAQVLPPLGIRPTKVTGAFWGQCLDRVMTQFLDEAEYLLTIDYDTFFTKQDVEHLMALAMTLQCDAITGLQTKREDGRPMLTMLGCLDSPPPGGKTEVPASWFGNPVCEVDTAHFGCTVISTAALKRMPHPWFVGVPNDAGEWGDGRLDDDIYFWKKWRECGNRVYVSPRVVLGHGEYMVTWPGANLNKPVYQHSTQFCTTQQRPADAWSPPAP
jgi:hypothetical protein